MWNGAGIFRNAEDLTKTLETVNRLAKIPLRAETSRNFLDCCVVRNMCQTASLICRSALIRKESRGAHVRVDIAQTWDGTNSPFGHTFVSREHEGIENRTVTP
jgi:fumarate reductase (CoM/CoB) subunit A